MRIQTSKDLKGGAEDGGGGAGKGGREVDGVVVEVGVR